MPSIVCPNCKYKTDENEQFCSKCGTRLQSDSEKTYCKSCSAELKPDALFCAHCGVKLNTPEETQCSKCGALLKEKDLFCPKCGTQNEVLQCASSHSESEEKIELLFQNGMEDYYHCRYFSAARKLKIPAEQGHPRAQYYLAQCLEDKNEAEIWKKRAAGNGVIDENAGDNPEELLVKAAQGDARAQYRLGIFYLNEQRKSVSELDGVFFKEKVLKWLQQSADQGYAPAQFEMYRLFFYPKYTLPKSYLKENPLKSRRDYRTIAIELLRSAAEKGHAGATAVLAHWYQNGENVKKDTSMAFHLYCQAAKESAKGEFWLGWCYEKGVGTAKDTKEASIWYQKAAEHGFNYGEQARWKEFADYHISPLDRFVYSIFDKF